MKKIAIDCRVLRWKHSGIARYLSRVLVHLLKEDKENIYYLLMPSDFPLPVKQKNVKVIILKGNDFIYKYFLTPRFITREKIDIYWSPSQDLPLWKSKNCGYVITIHDVAYEHDSSPYSLKVKVMHMLGFYRFAAILADHVFTDSIYSKKDIMKTYDLPEKKISVVYIGVDDTFKQIPYKIAHEKVQKLFPIRGEYFFYINTGRPDRLYHAFSMFLKKTKMKITLVSIGNSVHKEEAIPFLIKKYDLSSAACHITSYLTDEELNLLYSGSTLFVNPSYFEGFGLTPLEAMKAGAPVLSSHVTALPEILKDSVLYCDPYSIVSIVETMQVAITDKKMIKKKKDTYQQLLSSYTWDKTAKNILALFRSIN